MRLREVNQNEAKLIVSKGISHIDDQKIPVDKFINALKNIEQFEITEKVDGANLWMGLDMAGNFFTSRAGKGGEHYYSADDWGGDFKDTGFKSAHAALENKAEILKSNGLNPGDIVEVEILFGDKPNAIPYWPNQIIFLRGIQGDPNIEELANALEGKKVQVTVDDVPYTEDGETIDRKNEEHTWSFSRVQTYDPDMEELKNELNGKIDEIEKFLMQPNVAKLSAKNEQGEERTPTNIEVLAMRATTPEIKEAKELVKDVLDGERDETGKRTNNDGLRWEIKKTLLDKLVRSAQSTLGPSIDEGGWIEGVVLKKQKPDGDELYKVVDRDIFTAVNQFNHQVRNMLTDKHKGTDTPKEAAGLLGNMLRDMAQVIHHPQLGTIQAKRYLAKLGNTTDEKLEAITDDIDFDAARNKWMQILNRAEKMLEFYLAEYKKQYKDKVYIDSIGRAHKYDKQIHNRTLQSFAELKRDIINYKQAVSSATTPKELVMVLVGDKL